MDWKFVHYTNYSGDNTATCDNCGKGICHIFTVTDGETTLRLGSECVRKYVRFRKDATQLLQAARAKIRKERRPYTLEWLQENGYSPTQERRGKYCHLQVWSRRNSPIVHYFDNERYIEGYIAEYLEG